MTPSGKQMVPGTPSVGMTVLRQVAIALSGLVVLVLLLRFLAFLKMALEAVVYPFQLDYGEGIVWQQALLIPRSAMYGNITRFPFIVFHYPPFYHLVVRAVAQFGIDYLAAGRSISLVATLVLGTFIAAMIVEANQNAFSQGCRFAGAAIGALALFTFGPVVQWSPLMRVDMLAVMLGFAGMYAALRSPERPWLMHVAALTFVLAIYAKQTCLAAPVASFAMLLLAEPRRAVRAMALGLCTAGLILALLTWQTQGGFLQHIIIYNINRFQLSHGLHRMWEQRVHGIYLVLALLGLIEGWRRSGVLVAGICLDRLRQALRQKPATRVLFVVTLYFGLTAAGLVLVGKLGAAANYFIEFMCAWPVPLGLLATYVLDAIWKGSPNRDPRITAVVTVATMLLLLLQLAELPPLPYRGLANPGRIAGLEQLVEEIRHAGKPVLSEDMVLLLRAGQRVPWEPAIFAELASLGRWDERLILDMIESHAFAFIITNGPPNAPLDKERYTAAVLAAIAAAYPRRTLVAAEMTVRSPTE